MKDIKSKRNSGIVPDNILAFSLLGALIAGYFLALDYGMSWDIRYQIVMGKYNQAYISLENFLKPSPFVLFGHDKYYGPIHEIFIQTFSSFVQRTQLEASELQLYFWVNFSSFLLGVFFFYYLAKRYMRAWTALLASFLFFSQPLLFGHAFINSKDIPFMAFFIGSILLGLTMLERFEPSLANTMIGNNQFGRFAIREWKEDHSKRKGFAIKFAWVWGVGLAFVLLFWSLLSKWLGIIITQSMQAGDETFLGKLLLQFAENIDIFSLDAYAYKGVILFSRFMTNSFILGFLFIVGMVISVLPKTVKRFWAFVLKIYLLEFFSKEFIKDLFTFLLNPWVFLAGVLVGTTTSIRVLGPAAAGLVGIVFISRKNEKALAPLTAYLLFASIITYLTWPLLWSTGLSGIIQSIKVMTDFPWKGTVLFNGEFYAGSELPSTYLPTLLSIQLTEPVVIGFLIGIPFFLWLKKKENIRSSDFWLIIFWFFIPLIGVIFLPLTIYDNFRQFLFILPPIFIIVGIFLDRIFGKLRPKWLAPIVSIIILLPGIFSITSLHPYEYVYYNNFVGGVDGAFRQFEMDYWGTSVNEATSFINQNAPENAKILVSGPYQNVQYYARKDLEIFDIEKISNALFEDYDYAILLSRDNADLKYMPASPTLFQVRRDGAVYVVVRGITRKSNE